MWRLPRQQLFQQPERRFGQRQSPGAQQLSVIISLEGRRRRGHLDPAIILLRAAK